MLYHVYLRGNDRRPVVLTGTDRAVFLSTVGAAVRRSGWQCVGYCVMDNHYHLLLITPEPNLPVGMQWLNGTYARRFNTAHERDGHLWQGRYGAKPVIEDEHLMRLVAYLPMNPVKAGECDHPGALRVVELPCHCSARSRRRRFSMSIGRSTSSPTIVTRRAGCTSSTCWSGRSTWRSS